jgi:hypothetical protein
MAHEPLFAAFVRVAMGTLALLALPMANTAAGQDRLGPVPEFEVGWVGFADDGIVSESLVGGAVRLYVFPRISIGPEVVYIRGDNHSHVVATGNLTWDVFAPTNGRPRQVTPFLVAGGGVFQTRESFSTGTFTSSEGAFTAGGGVRALVGNRVTVGIQSRVGWELHLRLSGSVGVWLGR